MKTFKHIHNDPNLCDLNRIEHNGKRYYVSPNGDKLPSVTTFLSSFNKDSIIKWRKRVGEEEANRISAKATRRGTKFHSLMESYLNNEAGFLTNDVMPDMQYAFWNMVPALDRIDNIHYIEAMLYSTAVGLAGQVDLIAEYDGIPSIIDFKTSLKPKKEEWITNYFEQGAAYSLMYKERVGNPINQLVTIMAVDNEQPLLFIEKTEDHIEGLVKAIQFYNNQKDR